MRIKAAKWARVAAVTALLATGAVVVNAPAASASFGCSSKVTKAYKSGSTVIGVLRLSCPYRMNWLRVSPVVVRTGGGHDSKTFYKTPIVCYDAYSCTATFGVTDVSGSNKYWFTNESSSAGTAVDRGGEYGYETCASGIYCTGYNAYF